MWANSIALTASTEIPPIEETVNTGESVLICAYGAEDESSNGWDVSWHPGLRGGWSCQAQWRESEAPGVMAEDAKGKSRDEQR